MMRPEARRRHVICLDEISIIVTFSAILGQVVTSKLYMQEVEETGEHDVNHRHINYKFEQLSHLPQPGLEPGRW